MGSLVPLEAVLCTEELNRRPSPPPNYQAENRALVALAQALADSPRTILQKLADTILVIFQADSAGLSLLTEDETRFYWPAIAGVWKPHLGGGTPRDFGPCGDVLDRNTPLLFTHFERRYAYFLPVTPAIEECLLVPFYVEGKAVGTLWVIAHDDRRKFDAEDLRQLVSLGKFASAAYQALTFQGKAVAMNEALMLGSVRQHELTEASENLNAQLRVEITERTKAEKKTQEQAEALADQDRRKDEFLAMLSHELRNPLAALTNAVQLLRLQKNEEPLQQRARHIIERQVGQLKLLVDDLLEISRVTTGRVRLRQEQIDMRGIVNRAVETANPLIEQHRHELTVSLPPQPIWLHADAARLEQVVVNLLTNAAKYTDDGGQIYLTLVREGEAAVLRVRDTGIGIAPELLPRVFDLFTQAERSLDRSQGGLGIGLCLVQRLVDLHGGNVEAHSVLGHGSEFVVRLPVVLTSMPPSPSPSIETAQPPGKCCAVLVVDDNIDAAQSLAMLLSAFGHDVRMAHDGPSALEAALDYRPDLVLLDIGLPGLSGLEVAKRIRQQPALANMVLVAMTGYGQETDRQRSQEAGFDHHLVKPADFDHVLKILATVAEMT